MTEVGFDPRTTTGSVLPDGGGEAAGESVTGNADMLSFLPNKQTGKQTKERRHKQRNKQVCVCV